MEPEDLIAWRKARGLTQEQLADLLGITKSGICKWEVGDRKIPPFLPIALKCLKVKKEVAGKLRVQERGRERR